MVIAWEFQDHCHDVIGVVIGDDVIGIIIGDMMADVRARDR